MRVIEDAIVIDEMQVTAAEAEDIGLAGYQAREQLVQTEPG